MIHNEMQNDRTRSSVRALQALPGFELKDGWRGRLSVGDPAVGERVAAVRLLSPDHLRVSMPVDRAPDLSAHRDLPGNVRFALTSAGAELLADTCIDGHDHLHASLAEIRGAFARVLDPASVAESEPEPVPASADVRAALEDLDDVVDHTDRWELRPRVQDRAYAIRVDPAPGGLHLTHRVLEESPGDASHIAIKHLALRLNARLRLARLSWSDDGPVAEARLHSGQVTADWLVMVARAVAVASHLVRAKATILAARPDVAESYIALVIPSPIQGA